MNPIFDPGTSGAPQFVPGTNPQLFGEQLASTGGGDPGTVGGGQVPQTPGTGSPPAMAGGVSRRVSSQTNRRRIKLAAAVRGPTPRLSGG